MPYIEVDGQSIHYLTGLSGIAPGRRNIVFVHGAGGNALVWQGQIRGLDRGVNTICVDLPGHGQTQGQGCSSVADYSEWLLKFIHGLNLHRAIIAGHSMGSAVALEAAIQHPEQFEGLVLIGSGARLRVSSSLFQGLETDFERTVEEMVRNCYAPNTSAGIVAQGVEQLLAERPEVILGDLRACNGFDRMGQIGAVRIPTLVVCGSEDIMTPAKYSHYLADNLQRATIAVIRGQGHMVMVENPFKVNAAILKFLAYL